MYPRPPPSVNPAIPVWRLAACGSEPDRIGSLIELSPQQTGLRDRHTSFLVNLNILHWREVDHETCFNDGIPGNIMPAAANTDNQIPLGARRTAATTSAAVRQQAIIAGRRSIMPFQTRRASS